jgi:hypothetical protein
MVSSGTVSACNTLRAFKYMRLSLASTVLIAILAVTTPFAVRGAAGASDPQKKQEPAKKKTEQESSLTGCVDQQDGQYVLVDDHGLTAIADLVAEGFPTEGFAKHVGHKVTVRGTANSGGARVVMKVRNIETISETCAPQQPGKE